MEKVDAELISEGEKYFIQIDDEPKIKIPISEDNANVVKSAFNSLIRRLRRGLFNIVLKEAKNDLFYQVAKEYVSQLNDELVEVYDEIVENGFIDDKKVES